MDLTDSAALEATTLTTVATTVAPTGVTLSSEDFEQLYAAQEDPWSVSQQANCDQSSRGSSAE